MTYKNIVDLFQSTALSHKMVKEFVYCLPAFVNEIASTGRKYFLVVLSPATTQSGENLIDRTFNLMAMDIIDKSNFDKLQIQSDCEGIINDIYIQMQKNIEGIEIVPGQMVYFEENYGDFCAGASMAITIQTPQNYSCDLPFNPIP